MGRPTQFDRREAVEQVMNDIWRDGYGSCSVKAISEKLGITRSSFYNAFDSRESLFVEALSLYFSKTPDRVLTGLAADACVLKVITGMFREVCRVRAEDPEAKGCMAINSVAELVGADERLGPRLENALQQSIDRFEALLQQAVRNGEIIDGGNLREKALALQNLLVGVNLMSKVVRSEEDLWAIVRQTLKGLELYRP